MGISIKRWILSKLGLGGTAEIFSLELQQALEEYRIRELAFHTCVAMIANAVGKCTFKTYRKHEENRGEEYYLWNVEPNPNQNSTAFLHKLIYQLYKENEVLIISGGKTGGREYLAVADSFTRAAEHPWKENEYQGVVVGEVSYQKTFPESEVLHLRLNHKDIKPVLDGLYQSYIRLVQAAMKNYEWGSGRHLKVHVSQIANAGNIGDGKDGKKGWNEVFGEMLSNQVKPFLTSENGVLPEFDGYKYEDVGGNPDTQRSTRDIRALVDDIFDFTARGFLIPPVLIFGDVADSKDAMTRWLTTCIDPLCDQLSEEINRKRYGFSEWKDGTYLQIDTSAILHFDLFGNAANIEKLIGSAAFCVNDVLDAAGMPKINEPWANQHFVTKNFETLDGAMHRIDGKGGE